MPGATPAGANNTVEIVAVEPPAILEVHCGPMGMRTEAEDPNAPPDSTTTEFTVTENEPEP